MQAVKPNSQLFTLRLWIEDMGEGSGELRGEVAHVLSGSRRHFRDWDDLGRWVETQLRLISQ